MNTIRTVSDTKRAFYTIHTRPVNSIYRRVVEELMVEMHLLSVNVDFRYDPIYALGVTTTFDRFMKGYRPEHDRDSIFNALCRAIEHDPQQYRHDVEHVKAEASALTVDEFMSKVENLGDSDPQGLFVILKGIQDNSSFKYSRLFSIGLYSLLEIIDADVVNDEARRDDALAKVCSAIQISAEKVQKDLELYRSNLEKISQAQAVLEDVLKADRKKRQQAEEGEKEKEPEAVAAPPDDSPDAS
ncbi:MAG TPA: photosystem II biogenesis protein Psp29 [Elainellaceae cyanobacterium]